MRDPLYRISFKADALLQDHPPRFEHPHKHRLFEIAYSIGEAPSGEIEVTRWPQLTMALQDTLELPPAIESEIQPNFYDYRPVDGSGGSSALEWHVNFADPRLFVAYRSGLFAQDEMQVAEHPLLGSVREALLEKQFAAKTTDENGATPVLIANVERRLEIATNVDTAAGRPAGLYGNRFAAAPISAVERATRRVIPATFTNLIAMAAPSGGRGDYSDADIQHIFLTALTGFTAACQETARIHGPGCATIVHTGFWGCGAFGGNRRLMIALQSLAARAAKVTRIIIHAGSVDGMDDAERGLGVADAVAFRCGVTCTLDKLIGRCSLLGYQWGESDGN